MERALYDYASPLRHFQHCRPVELRNQLLQPLSVRASPGLMQANHSLHVKSVNAISRRAAAALAPAFCARLAARRDRSENALAWLLGGPGCRLYVA